MLNRFALKPLALRPHPRYAAMILVKAYGTWAIPLHESAVLPGVQGWSRFTDQNANRAR
jgi:hypothetical protein